jgi:hypothetical protein
MPHQTLYAYVDGGDLDDVAQEIDAAFRALVASTSWAWARPTIVNQKHEPVDSHRRDDLADWDLGLNMELPESGLEPDGWFVDVEQLAWVAGQVAARVRREFVMGIADSETGTAEDLLTVHSADVDLVRLRTAMGC